MNLGGNRAERIRSLTWRDSSPSFFIRIKCAIETEKLDRCYITILSNIGTSPHFRVGKFSTCSSIDLLEAVYFSMVLLSVMMIFLSTARVCSISGLYLRENSKFTNTLTNCLDENKSTECLYLLLICFRSLTQATPSCSIAFYGVTASVSKACWSISLLLNKL